jgi:hypothetical protein
MNMRATHLGIRAGALLTLATASSLAWAKQDVSQAPTLPQEPPAQQAQAIPQQPPQPQPVAFEEVQFTPAPGDPYVRGPAPPPPSSLSPADAARAQEEEAAELKVKAETPGASGWIAGQGFILRSADDNYKLRLGMQTAYKAEPTYQAGEFQDRRAFFVLRPIFAGSLFEDWIRFWTSIELNSNPPYLLDSYVEINPVPEFGVRIGQQYTLISRHEQFGPQQILFPEWSPVAEYFWTGRDKGFTFWGLVADSHFEYYAGLYGGSPLRQFKTISGNYVVAGRLVWNPVGATSSTEFPYIVEGGAPFRFSTSVQGFYGKVQTAEENFNPSSFRFDVMPTGTVREQGGGAVDLWIQGGPFVFLAEAYGRNTDPEVAAEGDSYTSVGAWGQIGFLLIPQTMDIAARFNWLDPSVDLDNDRFISGEIQLAYYVSHSPNLVMKLRYGYGDQDSPGMAALGPVSLFTSEGRLQIATAQLNLAF